MTVFIRSGLSQKLVKAVRQDGIDAAICLHPKFALPKSMAWEQLEDTARAIVLATDRVR